MLNLSGFSRSLVTNLRFIQHADGKIISFFAYCGDYFSACLNNSFRDCFAITFSNISSNNKFFSAYQPVEFVIFDIGFNVAMIISISGGIERWHRGGRWALSIRSVNNWITKMVHLRIGRWKGENGGIAISLQQGK